MKTRQLMAFAVAVTNYRFARESSYRSGTSDGVITAYEQTVGVEITPKISDARSTVQCIRRLLTNIGPQWRARESLELALDVAAKEYADTIYDDATSVVDDAPDSMADLASDSQLPVAGRAA